VSGRFDPKTREQNEVYYHDTLTPLWMMMTYTTGDGLFGMGELCRQDTKRLTKGSRTAPSLRDPLLRNYSSVMVVDPQKES